MTEVSRLRLGKFLNFKRKYLERVLRGEKTTTIRRGIVTPSKDHVYLACDGKVLGEARISSLRFVKIKDLTDADAKRDGFESRDELLKALREIYPDISQEDWVTVIALEGVTRYSKPLAVEDLQGLPSERLAEVSRLILAHGLATTLEEKRLFALLSLGYRLNDAARQAGMSRSEAKRVLRRAVSVLLKREVPSDGGQKG
ncbi:MAG: ASCH domain-containing protein [Thermofilum sp.]